MASMVRRRCASKHPRATFTGTDLVYYRLAANMYMTASRLVESPLHADKRSFGIALSLLRFHADK